MNWILLIILALIVFMLMAGGCTLRYKSHWDGTPVPNEEAGYAEQSVGCQYAKGN